MAMNRSPEAELAILLELLSAVEALEEHQRRVSANSLATRSATTFKHEDNPRHETDPISQADALAAIEQALLKANIGSL